MKLTISTYFIKKLVWHASILIFWVKAIIFYWSIILTDMIRVTSLMCMAAVPKAVCDVKPPAFLMKLCLVHAALHLWYGPINTSAFLFWFPWRWTTVKKPSVIVSNTLLLKYSYIFLLTCSSEFLIHVVWPLNLSCFPTLVIDLEEIKLVLLTHTKYLWAVGVRSAAPGDLLQSWGNT